MTDKPTERLARIETKLDTFIETLKDHETRIRGAETFQSRAMGAAGIVGACAGFLAPKLWSILPH